jgi:phasin family protein
MPSIPEQFATAAKTHFEAQLGLINALTSKAFEGVEKVIDLNVNATKTSLEEASDTVEQLSGSKDPQALLSAVTEKMQPNAEKALDYSRHLTEIAASMQAEFAQAAEAQVAETTKALKELVDEAAKNAPPGSENMVAIMQSVLGIANAGYDQLAKNTRQTVEALQANVNTATDQITQAAEKATRVRTRTTRK